MATKPIAADLRQFPSELIEFARLKAEQDADLVATCLTALGLGPTGKGPKHRRAILPGAFLLCLGAALRLVSWELKGFAVHREAGLPAAVQAVAAILRMGAAVKNDPQMARFVVGVLTLSVERFAWTAPVDLQADVVLGAINEDKLVEAVAKLLWSTRAKSHS